MRPAEDTITGFADRATRRIRNQFHVWMRLGVRAWEAAIVVAQGRDDHGLLVAAACACALLDIGLAVLLHRRAWLPLPLRGAIDSVDVAAWSVALGHSTVAAMATTPLALETGMRYDWRGLAGPLAVGTAAGLLRLWCCGRPLDVSLFLWPTVTAVMGAAVTRYLRQKLDRQRRAAVADAAAAAGEAELAGQNSIAVGADTIVDLLTRTTPLITVEGGPPRPAPLAAWKAALCEASSRQASYLGVMLARWQRRWNVASPDLISDVELDWTPRAGTLRLSAAQAGALGQSLDRMNLRGRLLVDVPSPNFPGREQVLDVGGRRVRVPADPQRPAPAMDLGPTFFLQATMLTLGHSLPTLQAVPVWVTGPLAGCAVVLAWWSHRHIAGRGPAGYHGLLAAALAYGACDTVLSTTTMRHTFVDNLATVPGAVFPAWAAPLFLLYSCNLTRAARWLYLALGGAIVGAAFALLPAPIPPWHVPVALIWPAAAVMTSLGLRDLFEQDACDLGAEFDAIRRAAVEDGYRRGRDLIIGLVAEAAADARHDYLLLRARLHPAMAAEVERRLREVESRLGTITARPAG